MSSTWQIRTLTVEPFEVKTEVVTSRDEAGLTVLAAQVRHGDEVSLVPSQLRADNAQRWSAYDRVDGRLRFTMYIEPVSVS